MSKAENTHALSIANRRLKAPRAPTPIRYPLCPRYDIETVYGLIKAFGGLETVAAEYCTATETVERWAISGDIPTGWHLRIFGKVCAMGNTIKPSVFGFPDDDEAGQALARLMFDARLLREGGVNE